MDDPLLFIVTGGEAGAEEPKPKVEVTAESASQGNPKVKPECHKCSYYAKDATQAYKCYTPSCPAYNAGSGFEELPEDVVPETTLEMEIVINELKKKMLGVTPHIMDVLTAYPVKVSANGTEYYVKDTYS